MYKFDYIPKQESDINDSLINLYGSHLLALYAALKPIYDGKDYAVNLHCHFCFGLRIMETIGQMQTLKS